MSKKLTLLSTVLLSATAILAQQDSSSHPLDEVVVTANKVEQKQSSTGKVVTVITKEQLDKSAGKTVAQVLNEQAGIVVNGALQPSGTVQTINMRGALSGRTLVLIDGIPVGDPSDINNNYDLNLLSLNDIERVEICKGAQSTLYGSDAVAGVINLITVKNDISKPINVKASLSQGNLSTIKANVQVYGKAGKLTYTASYAKLLTDGFSSAYDSTGKAKFDNDGFNGSTLNALLGYKITKDLAVKVFTKHSEYTADFDGGAFTDAPNFTQNDNQLVGAGLLFKKNIVSITANYQYGKLYRHIDRSGATDDYEAKSQYAELYGNIKLGGGFSLLEGVDYRYGSMNNQYNSPFFKSSFNDTSVNQLSTYTSLMYNSKKFNVEVGGRFTAHSRYGNNTTYTINPSYTINDHFRVFGSVATAFKAPSLYQLYANGGQFYPIGNTNLQPEKSVNYELGLQEQFKNFRDRIIFFYRDITEGIDFNNNSNQYFNYAGQITRGLEYEATVNVTKQLAVTANYTYLSTSQSTENRVTNTDTIYNYTLRVPKHSVNVTVGYQVTPAFCAGISGKYISSRFDVGGYDPVTFNSLPDVSVDGYFIIGVNANYVADKHCKFYVDAQNITNKKFFDVRGFNSIPFLLNIGVAVNW